MIIEKVISGGQYGADLGGLAAARDLKIPTGGYAPQGYRTIYGDNPQLKLLGLVECSTRYYPQRTELNVRCSDATIRYAYDFNSVGELLTLRYINKYDKPYYDINLNEPDFFVMVSNWILDRNIKILNIAGNGGKSREESSKIFTEVRKHLTLVLKACI